MVGFFDKFRNPEKVRLREEARAQRETAELEAYRQRHEAAAAAKAIEAEQQRREETAARIRDEELAARSQWEYKEIGDEMRGTTMSMAQLVSENSVDFPFPYNGGCQGMLAVRRNKNTREALFTVTNGQFDSVLGDYTISAKADDGRIRQWTATQPDGGSTTLMFIQNPVDFIRYWEKAERLIIEANFYQHGRAQFKFNVGGLDRRFR